MTQRFLRVLTKNAALWTNYMIIFVRSINPSLNGSMVTSIKAGIACLMVAHTTCSTSWNSESCDKPNCRFWPYLNLGVVQQIKQAYFHSLCTDFPNSKLPFSAHFRNPNIKMTWSVLSINNILYLCKKNDTEVGNGQQTSIYRVVKGRDLYLIWLRRIRTVPRQKPQNEILDFCSRFVPYLYLKMGLVPHLYLFKGKMLIITRVRNEHREIENAHIHYSNLTE